MDIEGLAVRLAALEGAVAVTVDPAGRVRLYRRGSLDPGEETVILRDLDVVEHWVDEAEAGRFEIHHAEAFVAGMPTYTLAAELALGRTLAGELPQPSFSDALKESAPARWEAIAVSSITAAAVAAERSDLAGCAGLLAKASIATAQARLAARGEWALDESGIVARAGLHRAEAVLGALGVRSTELGHTVVAMRIALGQTRP